MVAQAESSFPVAGEIVADRYRIEGVIGRGGMGVVLAATNVVTGRALALKWLTARGDEDALASRRLLREARIAARVRHENVVDVHDVGEHGGSLFLVMEQLRGETLAERLARRGAFGVDETLELMVPVLRGVEAAHRCAVVHRDLKPRNVFLCGEPDTRMPVPRVLDFGIARTAREAEWHESTLTGSGMVVGTPHYMAPEQLLEASADPRVDVYALGVMLYECLSGQRPFHGPNYNALVVQITSAEVPALHELRPGLPRALCALVHRALARDPRERVASVAELRAELERCARGETLARPLLRSRYVAAALGLGLAAAAYWIATDGPAPRASARPQGRSEPPPSLRTAAAPAPTPLANAQPPAPDAAVVPAPVVAPPALRRVPRQDRRRAAHVEANAAPPAEPLLIEPPPPRIRLDVSEF